MRAVVGVGGGAAGIIMAREDAIALGTELRNLLDDRKLTAALSVRATRRAADAFSLAVVGARLRDFVLR